MADQHERVIERDGERSGRKEEEMKESREVYTWETRGGGGGDRQEKGNLRWIERAAERETERNKG